MKQVIEGRRPRKRPALHSSWSELAINLQYLQVGFNRTAKPDWLDTTNVPYHGTVECSWSVDDRAGL
jgi:hypothetical protein